MSNIYDVLMIVVFILGYFMITIEHSTKINKTSIALTMAILCWILQLLAHPANEKLTLQHLNEHVANVSQVIFFLLGALTIVEMINVHKGFTLISNYFYFHSQTALLWALGLTTFFLSSVLDNLTSTIIMVTLMQKVVRSHTTRLMLGGAIVIAANAGGAWTPIGDVTTTMLWIGGQLSSVHIMSSLFLPSIACLLVALLLLSWSVRGPLEIAQHSKESMEPMGTLIFWMGVGCLIGVPILKVLTGLAPFAGILLGVGLMWLLTDILHRAYPERSYLRMPEVIAKIDLSGVLFFLGILLCINALETAGILERLALWIDQHVPSPGVVPTVIGLASAIIDNVPLVAASMGMYDFNQYPPDSHFWSSIAYCAGTGGSILVIGSAAGVALMGLERVEFFQYFRKVGWVALIAYFVGIGVLAAV